MGKKAKDKKQSSGEKAGGKGKARKGRAPMPRIRAIAMVARFDLLESLRSRKAVTLLFLYLACAIGGSALFIRVMTTIQEKIRERMPKGMGEEVTLAKLMESPEVLDAVSQVAGDAELAKALLSVPPMALFYGWVAMNFVPLLVLLTSSDAISGDVASGGVRYSLFRVDRASWAIGKLLGQTALMAVGVVVGALGCWVMGAIWLDGMPLGSSAWWLLRLSLRATIYSFSYLGIACCASLLVRTNARARGLALLLMFSASLGGGIVQAKPIMDKAPEVLGVVQKLFPNGHSLALWHPSLAQRGGAMVGLIAIGLAFFALGYSRFARRDA